VNENVDGEVTKLVPFGAFVKVADGIEGLVHISELAERHVEVPEAVVNVGDKIEVKVIDIDTVRRRISLSLKQAQAPESSAARAGSSGRPRKCASSRMLEPTERIPRRHGGKCRGEERCLPGRPLFSKPSPGGERRPQHGATSRAAGS
jgi:predicted RNA-binding protein with RPS1 domain